MQIFEFFVCFVVKYAFCASYELKIMILLAIILIGIITFGYRLSFIMLMDKLHVSPFWARALRFVPIAALTAIITPELLVRDQALDFSLGNVRLLAGVIATFVAWRTRNLTATLVIGMAAFWLLMLILK